MIDFSFARAALEAFMPPRKTPAPPAAPEGGRPGTVRVQKRTTPTPGLREKLCATCGKPFKLTPDQKFYDCPDCYRRTHPLRKPQRRGDATILIQIECTACGTREWLDFAPPDPKASLCRSCFAKLKREHRAASGHNPSDQEK